MLDAFFDFGAASAGKSFLIFASGPNGTSRNLTTLPPGAPAGCPLGNEQGLIVTVACDKPVVPGDTPTPPPSAQVVQCQLERTDAGSFLLVVSGQFFKPGALVTVGGAVPRKVKMKDPDPAGTNTFTRLI